MQTLRTANAVFTLSPTRNVGEMQAKLIKCSGKYKPTKIKADKRFYPIFVNGMSTADYVAAYHYANTTLRPYASVGSALYRQQANDAGRFFAPLNTEPCTLYTGEDSFETIPIDSCDPSELMNAAKKLHAQCDAIFPEFDFVARNIADDMQQRAADLSECEVIDFPVQIDARELQGAELDAAYAEFAFAA